MACSQPFPLSELHIDPATSEFYCDPCYQIMMLERYNPDGESETESWDTDDEDESGE